MLEHPYYWVSSVALPQVKSYCSAAFFFSSIIYLFHIAMVFSAYSYRVGRWPFNADYSSKTTQREPPLLYLGYFPRDARVSGVSERATEKRENPPLRATLTMDVERRRQSRRRLTGTDHEPRCRRTRGRTSVNDVGGRSSR